MKVDNNDPTRKYRVVPRLWGNGDPVLITILPGGEWVNLRCEDATYEKPATPGQPPVMGTVRGATLDDLELIYKFERERNVVRGRVEINPYWEQAQARKDSKEKSLRKRKTNSKENE